MNGLGYHENRHSIFHSLNAVPCHRQKSAFLSGLVAEDIRVTGIQDGHGGATEELSEGSAQLNLRKGKKSVSLRTLQSLFTRLLLWASPRKRISWDQGEGVYLRCFRCSGGRQPCSTWRGTRSPTSSGARVGG